MDSTSTDKTNYSSLFARLAYAGDLFLHRRILVLSDDHRPGEFLQRFNPRYTCTLSRQATDILPEHDQRLVDYHVGDYHKLDCRDGMYDVAIIPNVAILDDREAVFEELKRAVGRRGIVIAASPNPTCAAPLIPFEAESAIDYYELYDVLQRGFPSVQMIGQAPFLGYAVSDLAGNEDGAISFDGSLLNGGAEEIEWFMAICSATPVSIDNYTVVQIPVDAIDTTGREQTGLYREQLDTLELEKRQLASENERLLHEKEELLKEAEQLEQDLRILEDDMRAQERKGEASSVTQDEVTHLKEELHRVKLEMGTRGVQVERLQHDLEAEKMEAEKARERAVKLAKQLDNDRKAAQARDIEAQFAAKSIAASPPVSSEELESLKARTKGLEQDLKALEQERATATRTAEEAVARFADQQRQLTALKHKETEFNAREDALMDKLAVAHRELARTMDSLEESKNAQRLEIDLNQALAGQSRLKADLDQAKARIVELQTELDQCTVQSLDDVDAQAYEEGAARLEERLCTLGHELRWANEELERREGIVRDLTAALAQAAQAQQSAVSTQREIDGESRKISELENALNTARDRIAKRDLRIAKTESELQTARWQIDALTARSEDADARVAEAQKCMADTQSRLDDVNSRLKTADDRVAFLEAELSRAEDATVTPASLEDGERDALETDLARALGTISGHHRARVEAELALSMLETQLETEQRERDALIVQLRELETQVAQSAGAVSGHHRARVEAELQMATLAMRTQKAEDALTGCLHRCQMLEAEMAGYKGAIAGHQRARNEADAARLAAERKLEEQGRLLAAANEEAARLAHELTERPSPEVRQELQTVRDELEQTRCLKDELQRELDARSQQLQHTQAQLDQLTEKQREDDERLGCVERECQERQEALNALNHRAIEVTRERDLAQARVGELTEQLTRLQDALQLEREQHGDSPPEAAELLQRIDELKESLRRAQTEKTRMEGVLCDVQGQVETLDDALKERDATVGEMTEQLKQREEAFVILEETLNQKEATDREALEHSEAIAARVQGLERDLAQALEKNHILDTRVGELEHALREEQATSQRHRRDVDGCDAEIHRLREKLREQEDAQHQAVQDLHMSQEAVEAGKREVALTVERLEAVQGDLNGAHEEIDRLCQELGRREGELVALKEADVQLRRDHDRVTNGLRRDVDILKGDLEEARNRSRLAGEDAAHLSGETVRLKESITQLEEELTNLEAQLRDKTQAVEATQTERDTLRADLEQTTASLEATRLELDVAQQELDAARQEPPAAAVDVREVIKEVEVPSREQAQRIAELETQLETQLQAVHRESERNEAIYAETADFQRKCEVLTHQVDTLTDSLNEAVNKNEALQETIGQRTLELSEAMSRIADTQPAVDKAQTLGDEVAQLSKGLEESRSAVSNLQTELAARDLEISQIKGTRRAAEEKLQATVSELERLKTNETNRTENASDAPRLTEEIDKRDAELASLKETYAVLQSNLELALSELEEAQDALKRRPEAPLAAEEGEDTIRDLKAALAASQAELADLRDAQTESAPLIDSLTTQLEQRELEVRKAEKRIRMLNNQIQESSGDSAAWEMELRFRDAKIAALEEELEERKGS